MTDTDIGAGFAQTRGTDELFDDEIVPVSEAEQQSHAQQIIQSSGNGDGRHDDGKIEIDSQAPAMRTSHTSRAGHDEYSPTSSKLPSSWVDDRNEPPPQEYEHEHEHEPEPEPEPECARVPAVRGDRSATGGVRKVCSLSSSSKENNT